MSGSIRTAAAAASCSIATAEWRAGCRARAVSPGRRRSPTAPRHAHIDSSHAFARMRAEGGVRPLRFHRTEIEVESNAKCPPGRAWETRRDREGRQEGFDAQSFRKHGGVGVAFRCSFPTRRAFRAAFDRRAAIGLDRRTRHRSVRRRLRHRYEPAGDARAIRSTTATSSPTTPMRSDVSSLADDVAGRSSPTCR